MAQFLKLKDGRIINIEHIQQVLFVPDPPTVYIFWGSGYEETVVTGEDALIIMDIIDERSIPAKGIPMTNNDSTLD